MAKRKTAKLKKSLKEGFANITIDGADVQVPVLVERLLQDQRSTITYLEHILCLWNYKIYNQEDTSSDEAISFMKEMNKFIENQIPSYKERIERFEETDKKIAEEVASKDTN